MSLGSLKRLVEKSCSQKVSNNDHNNHNMFEVENNGVEIFRVPSQLKLEFQGNFEEHLQEEGNSNQMNEEVSQVENLEVDHSGSQKYQSYRQMCKDIEFIQMLGNPRYVMSLYIFGYFYSEDFNDYIKGLKCFLVKPQLMRLIKYPEGLYNLELLLKKGFMQALQNPSYQQRFIVDSLKRSIKIQETTKKWRDLDIISNEPNN